MILFGRDPKHNMFMSFEDISTENEWCWHGGEEIVKDDSWVMTP
jgi:hypothetical protein